MSSIDIVIRWVDDKDLEWQKLKLKYLKLNNQSNVDTTMTATTDIRYRDWELLRYWFRGVEKYADWVRQIFFVSYGHRPEWLNTNHPKLRLIKHRDFIPEKWLPTFSSRTIDFNIHRIEGLSEQFLLFDDDMFTINSTKETDFFIEGIPRDCMVFNAITPTSDDLIDKNIYNNVSIINKYFQKVDFSLFERMKFWFNPKYGRYLYKNIVLAPWKRYVGFQDFHLPEGLLKSTYEVLWKNEADCLAETCSHRFRNQNDVNQWLIRYWQLVNKKFAPRTTKIGKYFELSDDNSHIIETITKQSTKLICINEGDVSDFEKQKTLLKRAFETVFPSKSTFEV